MTCSMSKVKAFFPQRFTSHNIQLRSVRSLREYCLRQTNVGFQYQCIDVFLLVGELSERNGAGDVCRSVEILSTTV